MLALPQHYIGRQLLSLSVPGNRRQLDFSTSVSKPDSISPKTGLRCCDSITDTQRSPRVFPK